jgi:hypothetical protein
LLGQRGQPLILTHRRIKERRTEVKERSKREESRTEILSALGFHLALIAYGSLV